jgi:hypothetical protein
MKVVPGGIVIGNKSSICALVWLVAVATSTACLGQESVNGLRRQEIAKSRALFSFVRKYKGEWSPPLSGPLPQQCSELLVDILAKRRLKPLYPEVVTRDVEPPRVDPRLAEFNTCSSYWDEHEELLGSQREEAFYNAKAFGQDSVSLYAIPKGLLGSDDRRLVFGRILKESRDMGVGTDRYVIANVKSCVEEGGDSLHYSTHPNGRRTRAHGAYVWRGSLWLIDAGDADSSEPPHLSLDGAILQARRFDGLESQTICQWSTLASR